MRRWESRLGESVIPPLKPLYLTEEAYRECRATRPDFDWETWEGTPDIQMRRSDDGRVVVMVIEDTPAADAIRAALTTLNHSL